jgi:electron transport complex protein RnfD
MFVCVASAIIAEFCFEKITKRPVTITDCSAAVTGLLLAYNLPVGFPIWMAIIGSAGAIVVVKQLFRGIGQDFANPAIVGRIFLLLSFAQPMTTWVIPTMTSGKLELVAGATPLGLASEGITEGMPSLLHMFLGIRGGSLGETCTLALLIGGIYLIARGIIRVHIPLAYLATVAVFSLILGQNPLFQLMAGGVMLGAFFMATDYVTSPVTDLGKIVFGIGCGLITVLIRQFGSYPEGTSFAILLMNILTPHIDSLTRTKPFGGAKNEK